MRVALEQISDLLLSDQDRILLRFHDPDYDPDRLITLLHCALSLATQCIVIVPVCVFVGLFVCLWVGLLPR